MRYTKEDRNNIAAAFEAAQAVLWDGVTGLPLRLVYRGKHIGTSKWICHCLGYLQARGMSGAEEASRIVYLRLHPCTTMEEWLHDSGVPTIERQPANMQHHRHEWLSLLVKEFSDSGADS